MRRSLSSRAVGRMIDDLEADPKAMSKALQTVSRPRQTRRRLVRELNMPFQPIIQNQGIVALAEERGCQLAEYHCSDAGGGSRHNGRHIFGAFGRSIRAAARASAARRRTSPRSGADGKGVISVNRLILLTLIMSFLAGPLVACGKKGDPKHDSQSPYPRTYPNPK